MIEFVIPGKAVGKGRPRFRRVGAFVRTYTPEQTVSFENLVKHYASQAMAGNPPTGLAVSVVLQMYVTPPQSWSKKKRQMAIEGQIFPLTSPDCDNCLKAVMDACNEIVWNDDKQAVDVVVSKRYADSNFSVVKVCEVKNA